MDVIVGTYDEVILGFRVVEIGEDLQIEASFTDNSHAGSVRCVAISRNGILASGSVDETIRLFNLRKQRELGSLIHHDGSVTSLDFHKNFMFSTSEDGKLCIWKTNEWECLRTLKGHKAGVNFVSVHPTGKLALTVGKDRSLRTWNLITGRSAFITNLHQVADIVKWSPDGDKYLIVVQNKIDIYSVETAEVIQTIQTDGRINCVEFLNNDVCCYGGEGGTVTFYDIAVNKEVHVCETGTSRIKGLCISCSQLKKTGKHRILTIASSEGIVKLYKLDENKENMGTEFLVEHNSGFRVTCLAVFSASEGKQNKKKAKVQESVTQNVDEGVHVSDSVDSDDDNEELASVSDTTRSVKSNITETFEKKNGKKNRKRQLDSPQDSSKKLKTNTNVFVDSEKIDNKSSSTESWNVSTEGDNVPKTSVSPSNKKKKNKRKKKTGKKIE